MHHHIRRAASRSLAGVIAVLGVVCFAPARAEFVPGGGNPAADCYMGFDVTGITSSSGRIECTEGDPCDTTCGDGKCTFQFEICVNQPGVAGCTPPANGLRSVNAPGSVRAGVPATLTGASCGQMVSFDLKLKGHGKKKNKRVIRTRAIAASGTKPGKDEDQFTFVCLPRTTPCPSSPSAAFLQ